MNRRFCVAPMMDRTDRHERFFLRSLSKKAFLYTEMINVNALLYGDKKDILLFNECEHPLGIQLGGNDPIKLGDSAIISEASGYDEINLNIGCPSTKVQKGEFGAVLMKNPKLVAQCIKSIKNKVKIPVSVKCRIGVDDMNEDKDLSAFIKEVSDSGCKVFIVHARKAWLKGLSPKENRNIPPLNYQRVYRLKEEFPDLEIIINGGLEKIEDSEKHLRFVDGVMMGRNIYEDPYQLLKVDPLIYGLPESLKTKRDILLEMIPYVMQQNNSGEKIQLVCKHFMGLAKGTKFAKNIRSSLARLHTFKRPEKKLIQIANQLS
ncbi:MAG TPA: tRNA dihydrouridine(20/20a) synthase DusA [Gammaproteobacteria bacterium]|nr:tRNA dihydrouridine(20/20a) synthase DusA [Gammaproteobacteria bacterium]